jgi:hypothetical protein
MRNLRWVFWVVILSVVLVIAPHGALAQTGGVKTFPDGSTLSGDWLDAWNASPDPYTEFGTPITGVMESATGEEVLYTHQARFRKDSNGDIVIDPLGSMLYTPGKPANFSFNTGACRVYGDTGYHICYAFLQVYASHGTFLGAPLADPEEMNGRIVQAFEYGWLEWRPENPPNQRVIFMDLGRIAYDLWEPKSSDGEGAIGRQISMTAFAFVERAILPAGVDQTLFVIARTSDFAPLKDVIVQVRLEFPDGRVLGLPSSHTDEDGIARFTFPVQGLENGQVVQVQASLLQGSLTTQAATSFRIWH